MENGGAVLAAVFSLKDAMEFGFLRVDERFDRMDERFDRLEGRTTSVEGRLSGVERELGVVKDRLVGIEHEFIDVKGRLTGVELGLQALTSAVGRIDERLTRTESR